MFVLDPQILEGNEATQRVWERARELYEESGGVVVLEWAQLDTEHRVEWYRKAQLQLAGVT